MEFLLLFLFAFVVVVYIIGTLYGGTRFMAQTLERFDLDTKRGVLLMILAFVPVCLIAIAVGPFLTLWYASKSFRAMPWK